MPLKCSIVRFWFPLFLVWLLVPISKTPVYSATGPCSADIEQISDSDGYPVGTDKVANLPEKVGCWTGWTHYVFEYRVKDTTAFNEALRLFSQIDATTLEVTLMDGPREQMFDPGEAVDWEVFVVRPEWRRPEAQEKRELLSIQDPGWLEVRVYLGSGGEVVRNTRVRMGNEFKTFTKTSELPPGNIQWDEVTIPSNLIVTDRRKTKNQSDSNRE